MVRSSYDLHRTEIFRQEVFQYFTNDFFFISVQEFSVNHLTLPFRNMIKLNFLLFKIFILVFEADESEDNEKEYKSLHGEYKNLVGSL